MKYNGLPFYRSFIYFFLPPLSGSVGNNSHDVRQSLIAELCQIREASTIYSDIIKQAGGNWIFCEIPMVCHLSYFSSLNLQVITLGPI